MKMYFVLMSLLLSVVCSSWTFHPDGSSDKLAWLNGKWEGVGYQIDGQTWKVELNKDKDKRIIDISYPSLGCSGEWTVVKNEKERVLLKEKITIGADRCDQGVEIVLTKVNDTHVAVTYFLKSYSENAIAHTVLVKQ